MVLSPFASKVKRKVTIYSGLVVVIMVEVGVILVVVVMERV